MLLVFNFSWLKIPFTVSVCFIDNKEEHKKSERKQRTKMKAGFFCCKITFRPSAFWCGANGESADLLLATKTNENLRLLHRTTRNLRVTIKNGQPMLFLSSMKKCLDLWILKTNKSPCLDSVLWLRNTPVEWIFP